MKRKSFLIVGVVTITIVIALFFLRHEIIGHAFKVSISEKTHSTVELNIGHLYYDIFNSTVSLSNSNLKFHNIFINKEKTIVLSEFKFDEISLVRLSIYKLIFDHEVIAETFIVDKPSFWFKEDNNPQPFKEKPKEIIKSLQKHPDILGDLKIVVGEIEITHGKIDLTSIIDEDENKGSVEFKLLLSDINTIDSDIFTESSFLFAKHHMFKLSNFNYALPNGSKFSFDSLVFGSDSNLISISNIDVQHIDTNRYAKYESIKAVVSELKLFGIDYKNIDSLRDLNIDSIEVAGGDIHFVKNIISSEPKSTTVKKHKQFPKYIDGINLLKLFIDDMDFSLLDNTNDTIVKVVGFDFIVSDIGIDSTTFISGMPSYDKESILLNLNSFGFREKDAGLLLSCGKLNLDERSERLEISNLHINDSISGLHSFLVDVESIGVEGISIDDQVNKREMSLSLSIVKPNLSIDIEKLRGKSDGDKKFELSNIIINDIDIEEGNIKFKDQKKLEVDVMGLNIDWDNIGFFSNKVDLLGLDLLGLNLQLSKLYFNQPEKRLSFASGPIAISNNEIQFDQIVANIDNNKVRSKISIDRIVGVGADLEKLISKNEVCFKSLAINNPEVEGSIHLSRSSIVGKKPKSGSVFTYNVDDLNITNGSISLRGDTEKFHVIKSNFDINTTSVEISDINNPDWLYGSDWDIKLTNTSFENNEFAVNAEQLLSDKSDSSFSVSNLVIDHSAKPGENRRMEIIDIRLPMIELAGVDYNSLIDSDIPFVRSATIENAFIDLVIDKRIENHKQKSTDTFNGLPFELDKLNLDNLSFKLNTKDSISNTYIGAEEIDFSYRLDSADNLFDDIVTLSIKDFYSRDSLKNHYLKVSNVTIYEDTPNLDIFGINTGSIISDSGINHFDLDIPNVELNGIFISPTYPTVIKLKSLNINEGAADVTTHNKKKKDKGVKTSKFKLPNILKEIEVDEIKLSNIDLVHLSKTDTSEKKLLLNNLGLNIDTLLINSQTFDNNELTFASTASIYLGDNSFVSKDSLYVSSLKSVKYNFKNSSITVDSIEMIPRFKDSIFFERAVYQTGRMKLVVGSLVCNNFRIHKFLDEKKVHIGSIDAYGLNLDIFRNKLYDMDPKAYKKMPQEAILDIKQKITIDSVMTHNGFVRYKEIDKKSVVPGSLFLNKFNLNVYNINNDLNTLTTSSALVAKLNAYLFGQANLDIVATFPILSPSNDFWVTGHMDELNFSELNNLTENIVGVTMARGKGSLKIPLITGNSVHSEGSILFNYSKLKVELYDREKAQITKGLTGGMASLLLNDIFIKSNNPGFLGKTRPGEVYFKRNTQKSVVAYIWKSIMSGLMSTMGYNNKEQRHEKRELKKSKNKQ